MSNDARTDHRSTAAEENPSPRSGLAASAGAEPLFPTGSGQRGLLFIVSAPSGAGKTTLVERLVVETPGLKMSRSYTSRPARPGECDGVDYNFISRERFESMVQAGEFLEWASLYGHLYGTCAADTEQLLARGQDVVLVIDVQGARKVRAAGVRATTVFVMPPSFATLEQRLRGRSKDSEPQIQRRLQVARDEVAAYSEYDFVVVNDDVTAAVERLHGIVLAERARLPRMQGEAEGIVRTFS
ncbi:MAG TPA: guanylate kinase [Vicinamibacterales bacterium]|nr:guanylate kinase [Vicinamibacterales bacterium]